MRNTIVTAGALVALAQAAAFGSTVAMTSVLSFGLIAAMAVAALVAAPTLLRRRTLEIGYVAMAALCATLALSFATDPRFAERGMTVTVVFVVSILLALVFVFSCARASEGETTGYLRWTNRLAALPFFVGPALFGIIWPIEYAWRRAGELDEAECARSFGTT